LLLISSFLVFAQTKKADSPESESAFNVRDCELYERKTRLVDDIYRTTKSLCRSQAASTKNHLLNSKRHQRIKNRPTDFSTFFESSLNPGKFCIFGVFQYFLSKVPAQVTVAAT